MTENKKTKSLLGMWLWRRPLKFAFMTIFAQLGISLAWGAIANLIYAPNTVVPMTPLFIMMGIIGALIVVWLIRRLPSDTLDRHSFVTLNTAQNIVSFIVSLFTVFVLAKTLQTMFIQTYLSGHISTGTIIAIFATLTAGIFVLGTFIASMYSIFLRMRKLNVPMWKLIVTLPFGYILLWFAGFMTDDARKTKTPVIETKKQWYAKLINWITAHPYHGLVTATIIMLSTIVTAGISSVAAIISFVAFMIFGTWYAVMGATKLRNTIPTTFSGVAIVLNIIAIIFSLVLISSAPQTPDVTQITIADTGTVITQ